MNILIAPNTFKNSLPADQAAEAIKDGLIQSGLICNCRLFPIGDGGDGTARLINLHSGGNAFTFRVNDPLGRPITAPFYLIEENHTAVIEMADASGLRLLSHDELDPMRATSYGTGQLILAALDKNIKKIILCIGGSATVDGGIGILKALGFEFFDRSNRPLDANPDSLKHLAKISKENLDRRLERCEMVVLCDVENPLLGPQGAAPVFGPQKGASPSMISQLEEVLSSLQKAIIELTGNDVGQIKHGGAAGGVAASLSGLLNAKLVNGIEEFLSLTHFDAALRDADLVITGEGSLDVQTIRGKGPMGVAMKAKEQGRKVVGIAGVVADPVPDGLQKYFDLLIAINRPGSTLVEAMRDTKSNLIAAAKGMGERIASGKLLKQ